MRYRPYSIERAGLRKHLDTHTELGYAFFVKALQKGVLVVDLARLYDKSRLTIEKWIEIYNKEQGISHD